MFNHNTLESDIERLGREVAEKKNLPEHKETPERELIKQTIQPLIKQSAAGPQSSAAPKDEESLLPKYLNQLSPEIKLKVEKLIDSVFHEGLEKAVNKAKKEGGFVLDAFHDALTDKMHEELKIRNLI